MGLLSFLRRLRQPRTSPTNNIVHTFICGATRSGKSEAELVRLVAMAKARDRAIVVLDPPGTMAAKFLLHLDHLGLTDHVLYDRLADTDRVLGYDWLSPSRHPDPLQREAENDERIREFAAILMRRRGIQDTASTPLIEEGLLAALRLYISQKTPVPLAWLADVFTLGSDRRTQLLLNCTEPELVQRFHGYARLSPTARRTELGPAERILRAVCQSPSFRVRSGGVTFDFGRFLDERGVLILDGRSRGNVSRDAASIMMGAVLLRVIQHARTGARSRIVLVIDEAVNAGLIGMQESRALAEAPKWGLEFHVIVQDPFSLPRDEIRSNVLQNCGRHEWFRQGSPEAARLAAEDIAIPLLDPLHVHHRELRIRTVEVGYERVQMEHRSQAVNGKGHIMSRSTSWQTVLWPLRREVQDAQDRYTSLADQLLLIQKQLMLLKPGYRFVRADVVLAKPEYVPRVKHFQRDFDGSHFPRPNIPVSGLAAATFDAILNGMKQKLAYRPSRDS